MAYRFKRKEPVSKAIKRLGAERMDHALDCLKEHDRAEAIHCARKDIKKARAVARLARRRLSKKEYRRLIERLRKAASHLAAPRDAYIKSEAWRDLAERYKGQLAPSAWRRVGSKLRKDSDREMNRFAKGRAVDAVEKTLRRTLKEWLRLKVDGNGWRALMPGVKTAYREGQRAYRTVLKDPSPENLHDWRKRAKDLSYHVVMLSPIWPEQMEAIASELETLTDSLGDDHDLTVLQDDVAKRSLDNAHEIATVTRLIEQRQLKLRAAALAVGARFYAENASTFCDRLGAYWRTWRRKRKPVNRASGTA